MRGEAFATSERRTELVYQGPFQRDRLEFGRWSRIGKSGTIILYPLSKLYAATSEHASP